MIFLIEHSGDVSYVIAAGYLEAIEKWQNHNDLLEEFLPDSVDLLDEEPIE